MNIAEILHLKFPEANFIDDIMLSDRGQGIIITGWNMGEIPIPTQEDLNQWEIELDLQYRQQQAVSQRIYPPIGDQLDMIYKDSINNTTTFVDTIAAIKAAHPKPTE